MFTRDGEETVRPYIEGKPFERIVEIREAEAKLKHLEKAQSKAHRMASGLGFEVASSVSVYKNRAEIYATGPRLLAAALEVKGKTPPDRVVIAGAGRVMPLLPR